jgi:hypothetical protein
MIQDCRTDKPAGWTFFVTEYVPVIGALLRHYCPDRATDPDFARRIVVDLKKPESPLFATPVSEREFAAGLRQHVLDAAEAGSAAVAPIPLDLETLSEALANLTLIEKKAVWFETMGYSAAEVSTMMQIDPATVEKIRERAAELLRGKLDSWRRSLLADNGPLLRRLASSARTEHCQPAATFLDWLDGRITWYRREEVERHVTGCWFCIDLFCRLRESRLLLLANKPLAAGEAKPLLMSIGIGVQETSFWKRVFSRE